MKTIHFQIATPERVVFEAPAVTAITLPTKLGEITILPDHLPLVSSLVPGEVRVTLGVEHVSMAVSGGFIEVKPGKVIVLADTAERAEEIDEQRAEEARERARELMQSKRAAEDVDYTSLAAKLEKELARLRVVRKHKDRTSPGVRTE
jgi:F-type H+-transporting ATPase subunit epsilon